MSSFGPWLKSLSTSSPNIAYVFAALGYCFQAFLQIAFKFVARVVSPFHVLFMRAFCLFLLNTLILRSSEESPYIRNPVGTRPSMQSLDSCSSASSSPPHMRSSSTTACATCPSVPSRH
jgi:hypothetical protein